MAWLKVTVTASLLTGGAQLSSATGVAVMFWNAVFGLAALVARTRSRFASAIVPLTRKPGLTVL